jgi:hypothetical protein
MALPLLFMLGTTVLRAAGPTIAKELAKIGARKLSQSAIKKGGQALVKKAKPVNNNNLGTIRTVARPKPAAPKSGAPKAAPKAQPKAKTQPKTKADTKTAPKTKTQAKTKTKEPELKPNAKDAPKSVQNRLNKQKPKQKKQQTKKDEKKSAFGDKFQRGLIVAGTTAATFMDSEPTQKADASPTPDKSNRNNSQGGRAMGEGVPKKEKSFGQAFSEAYEKGVGTKFTHKGKQYSAVKDTDVKKAGAKDLRDYLNKKAGKAAKGMYASKKNIGANDYRMGGMLISVEDRRKMK